MSRTCSDIRPAARAEEPRQAHPQVADEVRLAVGDEQPVVAAEDLAVHAPHRSAAQLVAAQLGAQRRDQLVEHAQLRIVEQDRHVRSQRGDTFYEGTDLALLDVARRRRLHLDVNQCAIGNTDDIVVAATAGTVGPQPPRGWDTELQLQRAGDEPFQRWAERMDAAPAQMEATAARHAHQTDRLQAAEVALRRRQRAVVRQLRRPRAPAQADEVAQEQPEGVPLHQPVQRVAPSRRARNDRPKMAARSAADPAAAQRVTHQQFGSSVGGRLGRHRC